MKKNSQPSRTKSQKSSRREFLEWSGKVAAGSALAGVAIPRVHAAEDNTIRLALIGSGRRGSGAVANALESPDGPVKLVAMADIFDYRLAGSHKALSKKYADKVDVPPERRFIGFDAYKKAIDCLRPGDVALLTTFAAFRAVHLDYAVEKGVNVFMEKSFAINPPDVRRIIKAAEAADKKNLKVAAGVMCRHSRARQELIKRIRDGEIGQVQLIRAYRMQPLGPMGRRKPVKNELLRQISSTEKIFWVSGGHFTDRTIHQIDEICWIKGALPVAAHGVGGRVPNSTDAAQNLDSYAVEYTFADGTKATAVARYSSNCHDEFATYIHGAKCAAQFSGNIHAPTVRTYKDQRIAKDNIIWKPERAPCSSYQVEWNVLLDAIRNDRPHNEARRAAESNLAAIMGRAAVHSGKIITWGEAMASNFQFCPNIDTMDYDTPPPVQLDAQGCYPAPIPGVWSEI